MSTQHLELLLHRNRFARFALLGKRPQLPGMGHHLFDEGLVFLAARLDPVDRFGVVSLGVVWVGRR